MGRVERVFKEDIEIKVFQRENDQLEGTDVSS